MRVAVVDIGTNSTRLLVADVGAAGGGPPAELDRRSIVTRLGEGVDATGSLGEEPQQRVFRVLEEYTEAIDAAGCERRAAVMTSAVRDAANGAEFAATVRERFGLDGRTLTGDEEAELTFRGATAAHARSTEPLLVIDIGGGSTELVIGADGGVAFHVSTQAGVVRHSERHLHSDPPTPPELDALAGDARGVFEAAVAAETREGVGRAVAVAGTATQCAAIDLGLDPYDADRVEGHTLTRATLEELRDRLAALPLAERVDVVGLDPDRAPTIVAGTVILLEVVEAFGLSEVAVSERDILWGVGLALGADEFGPAPQP